MVSFEKIIGSTYNGSYMKENLLKVEEQVRELPFDPEQEVTAKDWQGMKVDLETHRQNNDWWSLSVQAVNMKFLADEEAKILD